MAVDVALDLLFAAGQTLVLASLFYFLYLVIRFGTMQPGHDAYPEATPEPGVDDTERPPPHEIAAA